MSASQVIILAEDRRTQNLAYHLLVRLGYHKGSIRKEALPAGHGAGNNYVLKNYASQVKASQQRAAGTILLVHLDADAETVAHRLKQLSSCLQDDDVVRDPQVVFHWIPKRNVETWLLWLLVPATLDEAADYKHDFEHKYRGQEAVAVKLAALSFFDCSRANATRPGNCPPSLTLALDGAPPPR